MFRVILHILLRLLVILGVLLQPIIPLVQVRDAFALQDLLVADPPPPGFSAGEIGLAPTPLPSPPSRLDQVIMSPAIQAPVPPRVPSPIPTATLQPPAPPTLPTKPITPTASAEPPNTRDPDLPYVAQTLPPGQDEYPTVRFYDTASLGNWS